MVIKECVPTSVSASSWIPFSIVILLSMLFSALFMRYFWLKREKDRLSAITATMGLVFALLTSFLLPVDIFLVSFMKNNNGTFKEWATNETRITIENGVTYTYYFLYAVILLFVFFLLPLVYFAYEEKENDVITKHSFMLALRYSILFLLVATALLLVGAFIPYRIVHKNNSTEWEIVEQIMTDMYNNKGADALCFILNILAICGMLTLIFYTGLGLTSMPVGSVRGWQDLERERMTLQDRRADVESNIATLKAKENLTKREHRNLLKLQEEEHLITRMDAEAQNISVGLWYRLRFVIKLMNIIFGIIGLMFGFLLWLSLLLTNIDRLMNALSYDYGLLLTESRIVNPLNYVMLQCQKVFPVDYVIFLLMVLFLVCCTISGVRYAGIRCFCIKLFKIRPHKTQPQALIFLCVILMFTVMSFNILMYSTMPQYITFGDQYYRVHNGTKGAYQIVPCTHNAPTGECTITRAASYLLQYFIKAWFFSLVYFWMTWGFLAMPILTFFWMIIRGKRSLLVEAVDKDDFEETDEDDRLLIT